jgi:iron complex transport system ATP-binding protein
MNQPAIKIDGLCVRRGRREILRIDSLSVEPGRIVTVLGPNGAGKSTLIKTCLGFVRPTAGRVTVLGQPVERLRPAGLGRLRRRVGYVPQILAARSEMPITVREVVAIGRTGIAGLFRRLQSEDWRIIDRWIERLELDALARRPYGTLSGGEQRKTLIAAAMVQQPELLLLDEPTANLDLYWREQIVAALDSLCREQRITMMLVCHELEVIPPECRRLLLLEDGRLSAFGRPEEVLTDEAVARLYGQRLRVVHDGGRHATLPVPYLQAGGPGA